MTVNTTIRILATGGTFDKHYDALSGKLVFGASHLPEALRRARMSTPPTLEALPFQDSLDMQDSDRHRILSACRSAIEKTLVVVHGTDTMPDTAKILGEAGLDKTIVLTGAMIPIEFDGSDATFNLGFACGVAQTLPPGVYIAMNATIFDWRNVKKNTIAGIFERI
jgi:L-asparaginase